MLYVLDPVNSGADYINFGVKRTCSKAKFIKESYNDMLMDYGVAVNCDSKYEPAEVVLVPCVARLPA
ncbi:hypothetical protein J6590_092117 [Homalodisca vitripennis]|nr:hypothetical protein J6590_092117 [Homalodisca vitripennis]